jgi:2-keto-3-deoxy-L-rhamnonate aldolase RhmA
MLLTFITNSAPAAREAARAGIDRLMIDLERRGKAERQFGASLFHSDHQIFDVSRIRNIVPEMEISVRVDPLHWGSREQIDSVIAQGAGVVMLPFFHTLDEVRQFLAFVNGRAKTALLVETAEALAILPAICGTPGVGEIHFGLNDLRISLNNETIFDVLEDGTVAQACRTVAAFGIPYGIGGIASLNRKDLPISPFLMLAAQVHLGCTRGWLGRTFRDLPLHRISAETELIYETVIEHSNSSPMVRERVSRQLREQIELHKIAGRECVRKA